MDRTLSLARLRDLCGRELSEPHAGGQAFRVEKALGPIGRIWLEPRVIERATAWRLACHGMPPPSSAAEQPPVLRRGEVGILLVTAWADRLPLLRPAFVLPVVWRSGGRHSIRLPTGLGAFADDVLHDVGAAGLSLHLADWLEAGGADLSGLEFSLDSAWAALAAGAIVAREGGITVPEVFVSAAWRRERSSRRGSIRGVDGIAAKLAAAEACGGRIMLLPTEHRDAVELLAADAPGRSLEICYLPNTTETPHMALAEVLRAIEATPMREAGATFDQRCGYFARLAPDRQNTYYCEQLLDDIVVNLSPALRDDPQLAAIDGVVVIASLNWSLACLVVGLFDPDRVLLLHDAGMAAQIGELSDTLSRMRREGKPRQVVPQECRPGDAFAGDAESAVAEFAAGCGRLVVDLTAGYLHYKFALLAALPRHGLATYIETRQDARYRSVMPQTAELRVIRLPASA